MKEITQYSYLEIKKFVTGLESEKDSLTEKIESMKRRIKSLKKILKEHDEYNPKWMVTVPVDLIATYNSSDSQEAARINWKKSILLMFDKYDLPMTSAMVFSKLLLNFKNIPKDRTHVLGNISAALHYLAFSDCKLVRIKRNGDRHYIYGQPDYFDLSGVMKEKYLEKFKLETDGQHMNRTMIRRFQKKNSPFNSN
jgi:hypothetical protein